MSTAFTFGGGGRFRTWGVRCLHLLNVQGQHVHRLKRWTCRPIFDHLAHPKGESGPLSPSGGQNSERPAGGSARGWLDLTRVCTCTYSPSLYYPLPPPLTRSFQPSHPLSLPSSLPEHVLHFDLLDTRGEWGSELGFIQDWQSVRRGGWLNRIGGGVQGEFAVGG